MSLYPRTPTATWWYLRLRATVLPVRADRSGNAERRTAEQLPVFRRATPLPRNRGADRVARVNTDYCSTAAEPGEMDPLARIIDIVTD